MSRDRRGDVATATLGYGSVAGAGALRHHALERAYEGKKRPNLPRVNLPILHERKLLTRGAKGRGLYAAGAVLGTVGTPAAAVGTARLMWPHNAVDKKDPGHRAFLERGVSGVGDALTERTKTVTNPAPVHLVAGNYLAGVGIGSAAGGLVHRGLRNRIGGGKKAALAATLGTAAGSASLPLQNRATKEASHGRYVVTPTGVRRAKAKRVPASRMASIHEGRSRYGGDPHRYRSETIPGGVNKADPLRYPGSNLSPGKKRAIVGSVVGPPIVGDIAQAATAARLAPRPLRKETAARTYGGTITGGTAGQVLGAYGAAHLASRSPAFNREATRLGAGVERGRAALRRKAGLGPKPQEGMLHRAATAAPRPVRRAVERAKTSRGLLRATGPLRRNPAVAAIGGLVASGIGGQVGTQAGYGSALRREKEWRAEQSHRGQSANHGTKVAKLDPGKNPTSQRERAKLAHRKQVSAAMSMTAGTTGLAALGITAAGRHPRVRPLKRHVPALLATGAGVGGANAFLGAGVQRKEAQQQLAPQHKKTLVIIKPEETASKALLRPTGIRRAPTIRAGTIRQTRYPSGMTRVSTVRGGLA